MVGTKFLLILTAWMWFGAFAAENSDSEEHNVCERLLDAELSGFYVAHSQPGNHFSLVQLRRLGNNPAYTVAEFKIAMTEGALEFQRQTNGWLIGDELNPNRRVNVVSLQDTGKTVALRFEDTGDTHGFYYLAQPAKQAASIDGEILNPIGVDLKFDYGINNTTSFKRIQLDNLSKRIWSESLKEQLASQLEQPGTDQDQAVKRDSVIVVELRKKMSSEDAAKLLGSKKTIPLGEAGGSGVRVQQAIRFAVPISLYEFLQVWPSWARRWEVSKVDSIPLRLLNFDVIQQLEPGVRTQLQAPPPSAPQIRPRSTLPQQPDESKPSSTTAGLPPSQR